MIQDTTFVVDVLRGDAAALERLELLESASTPQKLAAVTVLELHEGVLRAETPAKERDQVLEVLETKTVVQADAEIMRAAGRLSGQLATDGQAIDREDCIVAATARQEDEPVLTRNVDHFERVPDLTVETY